MQQQVTSYSFQLSQNLQVNNLLTPNKKSLLQCHINQPIFYCAAKLTQNNKTNTNNNNNNKQSPTTTTSSTSINKSHLYRLHFDEQNPRKSQIKKQQINGSIEGLYSVMKDSQQLLIMIKDNQGNYSLNKTTYPLGQQQQPTTINLTKIQQYNKQKHSLLTHKQTKRQFLISTRDIYSVNQQSLLKGQKLVQLSQQKQITYSIIDPIHQLLTYVVNQKEIIVNDKSMRKQKYALRIGQHDLSKIQSIDYNPNKQYYLMSTHLECIKFWDIRKPNLPVKLYNEHHSLLLHSKYNHSHDQLITCAYDDGTVGLLRMNSVSSTPGQGDDAMVKIYDQHQDSVFQCKWANISPWVFVSLSYAATSVVVNFVPSVEKYRILL